MSAFVKATAYALQDQPVVNAGKNDFEYYYLYNFSNNPQAEVYFLYKENYFYKQITVLLYLSI